MLFDSCKHPAEKQGNLYMSVISIGNDDSHVLGIRIGVTTEMARYNKEAYATTQVNNFINRVISHYLDTQYGKLPDYYTTEYREWLPLFNLRTNKYKEALKEIKIVHPFLGITGFVIPFSESKTAYEHAIIQYFFGDSNKTIDIPGVGSSRLATTEDGCFLIGERGMNSWYPHRKKEMEEWLTLRKITTIDTLIEYCIVHQHDWKQF